ncbi:hypothetical protein HaLaN_18297 [Haematococcus lacustris]|uniref:Uncharacterized protein n=1 Tax=Haematococcus lacustris TaxID=44745 RepID=A0A699ZQN9_HAELA|nr:hypothetical protein HaLaN_18297 [Haematococcus lacustris]
MTASSGGPQTTVPQQAAAAGPWVACQPLVPQARVLLALGWQLPLLWLPAPLQWAPPALPNALHLPGCGAGFALAALPWALGSAAGSALVRLLRLAGRGELGPGSEAAGPPGCMGPVGACGGPPPGTTSGPALAGHAAGSRLGALGGGAPALLVASSLQAWRPCACSAASYRAAGHSLLS